MRAEHLPAWEYQRSRWRNGLGWSREVAVEHDKDGAELWHVSLADIDTDCPYSMFPGQRREQVLLEGNGFVLHFAEGSSKSVEPPHGRVQFDGGQAPHCQLTDGAVRAFNLFFDPQRMQAKLHHRPLVGTLLVFVEPRSSWLIFLLAGRLQLRQAGHITTLSQGDSLRLHNPGETRVRALIEGGGELLLLSLTPAEAP